MTTTFKLSRRTFVLSAMCLAACKPGSALLELSGTTMGTNYTVVAVDHDRTVSKADLQAAVDRSLAKVNHLMSNWDAGSEVSLFNASTSTNALTVSPELAQVVEAAERVHADSEGYFDITLAPVIEAWGFGANGQRTGSPNASVVAEALSTTGQKRLRVSGNEVRKSDPTTQIFLSSIGKGFGVDHVAAAVAELGLSDFMVEIGGDLYVAGKNPDAVSWQIGIESPNPLEPGVFDIAKASNLGMATSGDYRNFFEEGGQRFSHIIDPHTGRPVTHNTASVTVLAENAMLADAWATALLAMGSKRGMEIAQSHQIAALFIERNGNADHIGHTKTATQAFEALQA